MLTFLDSNHLLADVHTGTYTGMPSLIIFQVFVIEIDEIPEV